MPALFTSKSIVPPAHSTAWPRDVRMTNVIYDSVSNVSNYGSMYFQGGSEGRGKWGFGCGRDLVRLERSTRIILQGIQHLDLAS